MRIAFDHQIFCLQTTGGIARYFCRLAEQLAGRHEQVGVFAPVYRNQYLTALPSGAVHGVGVKAYPPKTAGLVVGLNGLVSRRMIRRWQPDIVHETYFSSTPSAPTGCPVVLTVFDMISELGTQADRASPVTVALSEPVGGPSRCLDLSRSEKYAAVSRADHVICISEQTRQDLIRLFDTPPEKVSVAYLGCDGLPEATAADARAVAVQKPFLLYVGLRGGYKNFAMMLRGLACSRRLRHEFDVVAFGGGSLTTDEQALIRQLGLGDNQVRQIGGSDSDLAHLYQTARALVYPSTYEGFGLPPIEAMSQRCPVICSDRSSIPEVVGDAGEYFDPTQPESIAAAIERVVFSSGAIGALVAKGALRAQQFTWDQCAERHLGVYRSLIDA